jgi:hypothetical protein
MKNLQSDEDEFVHLRIPHRYSTCAQDSIEALMIVQAKGSSMTLST